MRKFFALLICTAMLFSFAPVALAGDITSTGVSQADLVAVISALVTAVNELKTDLNATQVKLDASMTALASSDNTAAVDNTYAATNPTSFTTIVLSPRAGY